MKLYYQPSGLTHGLDFLIANDWTPQQAFAVVELLDDLRDRIYAQYGTGLFELLREFPTAREQAVTQVNL
jgi:hypothetical protein